MATHVHATEPCKLIRGRAHLYGGDGRLRIWEVGTHHEYVPDDSSWDTVVKWLEAGITEADRVKYVSAPSMIYLFADFFVCPTEAFRKGCVQKTEIKSASHRRYTKTTE
jgi:hypothetical protein